MKKIFAVMAVLALMSGASWADIVYTTDQGNLGFIKIRNALSADAPQVRYSGLGDNAAVTAFWDGRETKIIAIDRAKDGADSDDRGLVFRASNLSSPITDKITLHGVRNTRSAISSLNGKSLFFASYANGSIVEFDTEHFTPVRSYKHQTSSRDIVPHVVRVATDYRSVYGLVEAEGESVFLRFDGQLKSGTRYFRSTPVKVKVSGMSMLAHGLFAVATSSGIGYMNPYYGEFTEVLDTDAPVKSVCPDNGDGYYFVTQELSGEEYVNTLGHRTGDETVLVLENGTGERCGIFMHFPTDTLVVVTSDKIMLYRASTDEFVKEYTSEELGGNPVSVTSNYSSGYSERTSSSNCNISGSGMVLLLSCAVMIMKRRK